MYNIESLGQTSVSLHEALRLFVNCTQIPESPLHRTVVHPKAQNKGKMPKADLTELVFIIALLPSLFIFP